MTFFKLLVCIFAGVFFAEMAAYGIQRFFTPTPPPPPTPKPPLAPFLKDLDTLVKLEVLAVVELPKSARTIKKINDFSEVQSEIIHNVLEALSTLAFIEANKVGIKRDYVIMYVTRKTNAELLNYMKEHNYQFNQ